MTRLQTLFLCAWLVVWTGLAWLMLTPRPPVAPVSDKIVHFAVYLTMTAFALSFSRSQLSIAGTATLTAMLASLLEYLQGFVPGRSFDPADLLANGAGIASGWLLAATLLLLAPHPLARSAD